MRVSGIVVVFARGGLTISVDGVTETDMSGLSVETKKTRLEP